MGVSFPLTPALGERILRSADALWSPESSRDALHRILASPDFRALRECLGSRGRSLSLPGGHYSNRRAQPEAAAPPDPWKRRAADRATRPPAKRPRVQKVRTASAPRLRQIVAGGPIPYAGLRLRLLAANIRRGCQESPGLLRTVPPMPPRPQSCALKVNSSPLHNPKCHSPRYPLRCQKWVDSIRYCSAALEVRSWAWLTRLLNLRSRIKASAGMEI